LNGIPVEWINTSDSDDFARTWNDNWIEADGWVYNVSILIDFSEDKDLRLDSWVGILLG
jgi:hypothetical protein